MAYKGAVIGYGGMGRAHAELLHWTPKTELVAVCDVSQDRLSDAKTRFKGIRVYETSEEMFAKENLDLVSIATHANSHADLSRMAAEVGAHVVCEKPIASSLAEADEMVDFFAEKRKVLAINHQWRLGPAVEKAAEMVADGKIGVLSSIIVNFGKGRAAGYELFEIGTHAFDIVCKFAGAPIGCRSHILTEGCLSTREDVVRGSTLHPGGRDCGWVVGTSIVASFHFDSGVIALAEAYRDEEMDHDRMMVELRGTEGRLRLVDGQFSELWHSEGIYPPVGSKGIQWEPVSTGSFAQEKELSQTANTMIPVYESIVRSVETGEPHPCSGEGARSALEMITAVFTSHFAESWVPIPVAERKDPLAPLETMH